MGSINWEKQVGYVQEYYRINGEWPSDTTEFPSGNPLGEWCRDQRSKFKRHLLNKKMLKRLLAINFSWMSHDDKWALQFKTLREYRSIHAGKFPNPDTQYPPGNFLGRWCAIQRRKKEEGTLTSRKQSLLNRIDFPFSG